MKLLKDDQLIDCYLDASRLKLDNRFICLLMNEIKRRSLSPALYNLVESE